MASYLIQNKLCFLQIYDKGNIQSNIAILFLHSGPGSGTQPIMDHVAFQTLEELYHCIYFDQGGSGNSSYDIRNGITIDEITTDVFSAALQFCLTENSPCISF